MSIPLRIHVDAMGFSGDETKLFVLDRRMSEKAEREKEPDSVLQPVEVSNGDVSNEYPLGKRPVLLLRSQDQVR